MIFMRESRQIYACFNCSMLCYILLHIFIITWRILYAMYVHIWQQKCFTGCMPKASYLWRTYKRWICSSASASLNRFSLLNFCAVTVPLVATGRSENFSNCSIRRQLFNQWAHPQRLRRREGGIVETTLGCLCSNKQPLENVRACTWFRARAEERFVIFCIS